MVKHIILWKLHDSIPAAERPVIQANAKAALEGLVGQIDGLLALQLQIDPLPSSNADMLLVATLDSVESLQGYQKSPLHNAVADRYVRPYTAQRLCLDYEE